MMMLETWNLCISHFLLLVGVTIYGSLEFMGKFHTQIVETSNACVDEIKC